MTKTFITEETRKQLSKFTRVSDELMFNLGIERQGYCQMCGHEIQKHFGVKSPDGAYYWVGSECLKTLTGSDPEVETSSVGTVFTKAGLDWVNVGKQFLDEVSSYLFVDDKDKYDCPVKYSSKVFSSIIYDIVSKSYTYGRRTGEYVISVKQLAVIQNWAKRNGIELQTNP